MRDALSLLDQTIAYGNGSIHQDDVRAMLGCMTQDDLVPLLQALAKQESTLLFHHIAELASRTPDFHRLLEELITIFHHLALCQLVPDAISLEESIAQLAKQFTSEEIQLYYQIALLGRRDLSLAPNEKQGFEMMMLRMLSFHPHLNHPEKINILEKKSVEHLDQTKSTVILENEAVITQEEPLEKQSLPPKENKEAINWRHLLSQLELSGMTYALASNCTLEKIEENKILLALSKNHAPMLNQKLKERIQKTLNHHF